jgi:D-arabinose 1-dehydrogenase-like Zn-dependent alcohol dehydrogenase
MRDQMSSDMKAVRLFEYGGQLVFNDVPTPTIARDEVLVEIKSTAVNHVDLVKASGTARQILPIDLPWIPGHEFSGVVEQLGSDVAAYAPGDAVFGTSGIGAYAEYLERCTRSRMQPRPGRTWPGTCRPVGRERQDAGHTARSCFVWPRNHQVW